MLQASAHGAGCRQVAIDRGNNLEAVITCTNIVLGSDSDDMVIDADDVAQAMPSM